MLPRLSCFLSALLIFLITLSIARELSGQSTCNLQGPPPAIGAPGYTGQSGHAFDYWSDEGGSAGAYFFQLLVKNVGAGPLTFDWENASFFRRGVATGAEARSECRSDGNRPNVTHGVIRYGPNTQFPGPDAKFYHYQQGTTQARDKLNILVKWTAILESGEQFPVDFAVQTARTGPNDIQYIVGNFERAVEVDWPIMLPANVLAAVQKNFNVVVRNNRLAIPAGKSSLEFKVSLAGAGPIATSSAPLSVYTPDGLLLYRDVFTGFTPGSRLLASDRR